MWPDVYLSSHQGHKLSRAGRGWHTAVPPPPSRCQTTLILTCRAFATLAQGLPGDQQLENFLSSARLSRHGPPGAWCVCQTLFHPQSPGFRVTNKNTPGALWFSCDPAVQEKGCLPRNYSVFEMQCGLVGSLQGWESGAFFFKTWALLLAL